MHGVRFQRQVAELVDDQQLRFREAEQLLVQPLLGMCLGEAGDERHGDDELHRVAGQDRLPAERDRKVRLADPCRPEQQHVLAIGDPSQAVRSRTCFGSIEGCASKSKPASSFPAGKCASFSAISMRR